MNNFELWVKGCEENNTLIYPLEKNGNISLYKTWRKYFDGRNYFNTNIMFHVWDGDKNVCCYTDYLTCYKIFERLLNK